MTFDVNDYAPAGDGLAIGGPDEADCVVYNYGDRTARPGIYYLDRSDNQEYIISTTVRPEEIRMDDLRVVFIDRNASRSIKYAFLKQPDVQVTAAGITFSQDNPAEGTPIDISVLVPNLSGYNQAVTIIVGLYDGDPDAEGIAIGTPQMSTSLAAHSDHSVTFSNITSLAEGTHSIYAKLTVSTSDPAMNNKAFRVLTVSDTDDSPPTIVSVQVVEVNGDGDGIIGADEDAQLNLVISDPSGVGSVQILLNGAERPVSGPLTNCSAALGKLPAGQHNLEIRATDADFTPSSRTNFLSFAVVSAERIAVSFGAASITSGQTQPVDLGVHEIGSVPSPIFIVENSGQQHLVISNISVTGSFSASGPLTSQVHPSGLTGFTIRPSATAVGSYTGMVAVASSDALSNPYSFPVRATVTFPKPALHPLPSSLGGPFRFQFATVPGLIYLVEASTNLVTWETVLITNATMNLVEFVETNMSARPQRFYRVEVQSGAPQPSGLVAYYPFDGNANDASGNANHASTVQAAFVQDRFDQPNSACSFNGINQYVAVPDSPTLSPPNQVSFSAWILSAERKGAYVLKKGGHLTDGSYVIALDASGVPSVWISTSTKHYHQVSANSAIPLSTWTHVCGVYNGQTLAIYVNGQLSNTTAADGILYVNSQPLYMGCDVGNSFFNGPFNGRIDDVRIYTRALSAAEIQQLSGWIKNPANGHHYQVVSVSSPITWADAQADAVSRGGYLATITSAEENAFVYSLALANANAWGLSALLQYGPWLGGFQPAGSPEPAGGWQWVNGEGPFAYTSWNTQSEPNDEGGAEDRLHFHALWAPPGTWNDLRADGEGRIFGYVVEREQ